MCGPDCFLLRANGNSERRRACGDRLEVVPGQDRIERRQICCVDCFPARDRGLQIRALGDVALAHWLSRGDVAVVHGSELMTHCAVDCQKGGWWRCATSACESAAATLSSAAERRKLCVERSRRRNYF